MATEFEKGFRDIFLAGVGAMAITGEKAKKPKRRLQRKRRNNPACSERGRVLLPRSFYIGAKPLVYLVGSTFWGKFRRRLPLRLLVSSL